jgi:2-keto-4-pentenoate hydratase/2-oxohepta-3-ene-1,7-dioic acid hydratase in catechol pathway
MRFVTYQTATQAERRLGALTVNGLVVDLQRAYATLSRRHRKEASERAEAMFPLDMIAFLERGGPALEAAAEAVAFVEQSGQTSDLDARQFVFQPSDVTLAAPLPRPLSIRDFSTVEEHYRGARIALGAASGTDPTVPRSWYDWPPFYMASPLIVVGPEVDVEWPSYATEMDYELEVAMVIGKRGKDISLEDARGYIAGFTIFNDLTARNVQQGEWSTHVGFSKSKGFDTGNVLGPYLVTPDEFDGREAVATVRINGETRAVGNLNKMHHSWERLIEHTSQSETIHPGEVFASGSIGKGSGMELRRYLQPDDVVELEVEGLGVLRNRIVDARRRRHIGAQSRE